MSEQETATAPSPDAPPTHPEQVGADSDRGDVGRTLLQSAVGRSANARQWVTQLWPRVSAWARALPPGNTVLAALLYLALFYVLQRVVGAAWWYPPYHPDSWSYVELSRSAWRDPGRINTYRSFVSTEPYTASFPLAWPMAMGLINFVTGVGDRSGLLGASIAVVAAAVMLDRAGRKLTGWRGLGPATMLVLFAFHGFEQEVLGAGSIPMAMALLSGVIMVAANPWPLTRRQMLTIGVTSGLLVLTRFDALALVLLLPFALVVMGAAKWRGAVVAFAAMAATLLPWVAYSLARFNRLFVTDNSAVALSARPMYVLDYPMPKAPTAMTDPSQWLSRVRGNLGQVVPHQLDIIRKSVVLYPILGVVLICMVGSTIALMSRRSNGGRLSLGAAIITQGRNLRDGRGFRLFGLLSIAAFAVLTFAQSTTAYFDARYSSVYFLCLTMLGFCVIASLGWMTRAIAVVGVALVLALGSVPVLQANKQIDLVPFVFLDGGNPRPEVVALDACVQPGDVVFFADVSDGMAFKFGALSDKRGVVVPTNWPVLSPATRTKIFNDYQVTLLYLSPAMSAERQAATVNSIEKGTLRPTKLVPACRRGLYQVTYPGS